MIMPAVQKPHWNACASRNACCIGCSSPSGASPSIVVTSRPSARKAGIRQLWTGMPSSQTVQAPQSPASQPFLTPNKPWSRRNVLQALARRGSAESLLPLTVKFMCRSVRQLGADLLGVVVGQVALVGAPSRARRRSSPSSGMAASIAWRSSPAVGSAVEAELDRPDGGGGDRQQEVVAGLALRADRRAPPTARDG